MMRAVMGQSNWLRIRVEGPDGSAVTPDSVTATLTDRDGVAVFTDVDATQHETGPFYVAWSPSALGVYRFAWTAVAGTDTITGYDDVTVVGKRSQPLSVLLDVPGVSAYPIFDQLDAIDAAEGELEGVLGFALAPQSTRVTFRLRTPTRALRSSYRFMSAVTAVTKDGTALDHTLVEIEDGRLTLPGTSSFGFLVGTGYDESFFPGKYVIDLEHGMSDVPGDLRSAVKLLTRSFIGHGLEKGYSDRASRYMSAETEVWLARPSETSFFGIPEVDVAVAKYRATAVIADASHF